MARRACITALALALASVAAAKPLATDFYSAEWLETCATGKTQSPVDLVSAATSPLPAELVADIAMPVAEGVVVLNVGHALQVCFSVPCAAAAASP